MPRLRRGLQYWHAKRAKSGGLRIWADHGVRIGMAESGGSRGGVQPGRINGTMMDGMLPVKASASIGGAIDAEGLYGNRRPHVGIGMMAPEEA